MDIDYDAQAGIWHTDEPRIRSDLVGRPEVLEIVREIGLNKIILDAGCAEGYFSRQMARITRKVIGIDKSEEMIRLAREQEKDERKGIEYHVGDVRDMPFKPASVDVCVGNYITNYIHPDELPKFYMEMARVLNPDGVFVLMMPHPVFELDRELGKADEYGVTDFAYFRDRGKFFTGKMPTLQGTTVEVGLYHSTLNDHSAGLVAAGMGITKLLEPEFPKEIAEQYPVFKDMAGKVACLILVGEKFASEP